MLIENVSDTARWVAIYRAMESERPDALFRDPYAARLGGAKGEAIVDELPRGRSLAWPMIVRTAVFDEMILDRIAHGVDLVIDLAAGLDTRAWRLPLPSTLRWVDVDLPAMTEYKASMMADEKPVCDYEAIATDLTDADARRALLAELGARGSTALVLTEGLLIYLTAEQVTGLARDLHATPTVKWWITDIATPMLLQIMNKHWGRSALAGNAPFIFAPEDSAAFFRPLGWREEQFRSGMDEARRLKREMKFMWLWRALGLLGSPKRQRALRRMSGYLLLERADAS